MPDNKALRVEISYKTVIFTVGFLLGLWFLVHIRDIIILVFLSLILLSALLKPVELLENKGLPRLLSVILVYLGVIGFIVFSVGVIIPPLVSETSDFISRFPQLISEVNDFLVFNKVPVEDVSSVLGRQLNQFAGNVVSVTTAIFSSIFLLLTLLVITFYMLLDWKNFVRLFASPFSGRQEKQVISLVAKIEKGLGYWVRGQLMLSLIIGVVTYIGLRVLGIPYALPLALIAGILEIIPIVGPIIASVPAILIGLSTAPILALAVGALFFIVQQLENHIIVPMVMSKVVGLQPPIIIVALLIGAKLAGIGGAFLAVPIIVVTKIAVKEFLGAEEKLSDEMKEA